MTGQTVRLLVGRTGLAFARSSIASRQVEMSVCQSRFQPVGRGRSLFHLFSTTQLFSLLCVISRKINTHIYEKQVQARKLHDLLIDHTHKHIHTHTRRALPIHARQLPSLILNPSAS